MKIVVVVALVCVLWTGAVNGATSCVGRCGENDGTSGCQCNVVCPDYGDCCSDYEAVCFSCADRCGDTYVPTAPCHCNSECSSHNNCCGDYDSLCDGGSPGTVTDADLEALTEELYALDSNNLASEVVIDMQGQTSSGASGDVAPNPLFTSVPALTGETYMLFEALRDNYEREEMDAEVVTAEEESEEAAFLDAVLATPLMVRLDEFMAEKQLLTGTLRENIETIWFTLYPRYSSVLGSSGFEHVFIGETDGGSVGGFHSWVGFYEDELAGNANYQGYIEFADFGDGAYVLTDRYTWYGADKAIGGSYIATSPEFDLAVFTVCWFTRPNALCPVSVNGVSHQVQTWEEQYGGQTLVGSAYPVV